MDKYETVTTTISGVDTHTINDCKHDNGFWATIPFWIFCKRVYICYDCDCVLDEKREKRI